MLSVVTEGKMAMQLAPRIVADPNIRFGKPVIEGTRVPVSLVVAKLGGGMTKDEVATEYGLSLEEIRAALSYATGRALSP